MRGWEPTLILTQGWTVAEAIQIMDAVQTLRGKDSTERQKETQWLTQTVRGDSSIYYVTVTKGKPVKVERVAKKGSFTAYIGLRKERSHGTGKQVKVLFLVPC